MARKATPSIRYYFKEKKGDNGKDKSQVLMVVSYDRKRLNINMGLPMEGFLHHDYSMLFSALETDGSVKKSITNSINPNSPLGNEIIKLSNFLSESTLINMTVLSLLVKCDYWKDVTPRDFMMLSTFTTSVYVADDEKKARDFIEKQCPLIIQTLKERAGK